MMMNSYFEQGGFYNGGPTATETQNPYRFPQSLLVPPYGQNPGSAAPRNAHESSAPYGGGDPNSCKMYNSSDSTFKAECLVKEQNGFSQAVVKEMVNSWPAAMARASEQMRSFATENSAAPRGTEWQQCCQTSPPIGQTHSNTFYPWMAVQGLYSIVTFHNSHLLHSNFYLY
ncbi:hypothetical protein JTE90_023151 [Oedothorax gibbosus]|uniref:Uncharacterized protein n=1 Tax=Oedothorax gibbosus TaxID=931172 RepID=A0AAV6UPQ3_9ARAC|nr:hypothetical protein JTE90_023151 [Oedothorax gibbosus]